MAARLAVVGDVHLAWEERDTAWFRSSGYDRVLFVGDLANYRVGPGLQTARRMAALGRSALFLPGNHDAVTALGLLAEALGASGLARVAALGHERRLRALRRALAPLPLVGYSTHSVEAGGERFAIVAARPHAMGGSRLSFPVELAARFGVTSLGHSSERLCELVDRTREEHLVFLAHNGPTGLGARRSDVWGCDFRRREGDFGDADLRAAIDHAQRVGKRVLAVVAGHMHHALKGGGTRRWLAEQAGILYVNAARVPRIEAAPAGARRHHVELVIEAGAARARERWVEG